jgi:hypothetical protein
MNGSLSPLTLSILLIDKPNQSSKTLVDCLCGLDRHVGFVRMADNLPKAREQLSDRSVNCIFVDPLAFELAAATDFIFETRENQPDIVFTLVFDVRSAELRQDFYQGHRARWRHYHRVDKNSRFLREDITYMVRNCRAYLRSNAYGAILRSARIVDTFFDNNPQPTNRKEPYMDPSIIGAVAAALEIAKNAPGAIEALKRFGIQAGLLKRPDAPNHAPAKNNPNDPLLLLTQGLAQELTDLTLQYNTRKDTWQQPEREAYQKIVAAKACDLLETGQSLLAESVSNVDKVHAFFAAVAKRPVPPNTPA